MKIAKRMVLGFLVITLTVFACLVVCTLSAEVRAETLTVDDDGSANFTSIRQAIENASDGDTIRVYAGTYHENVVVDRAVILIGNGSETKIDGHDGEYALNITIDGVNVSGFELNNATNGIVISSDENIVTGNDCTYNTNGIYIEEYCDGNRLDGNNCSSNTVSGIRSITTDENIISNNVCNGNPVGLRLYEFRDGTIIGNTCSFNTGIGIYIYGSSLNNTLQDNVCNDNGMEGIHLNTAWPTVVLNNICNRNQQSGIYLSGSHDQVRSNTFSENEIGIILHTADNATIENNTIIDNEIGIYVELRAESNQAHDNNIFRNSDYGILVDDNDGFTINATMNWWGSNSGPFHSDNQEGKGNEVSDRVIFDPWVTKQQDYQVSFNRDHDIFVVQPDEDYPGNKRFTLTVFNEGNVSDTFSFELEEDAETDTYGHWLDLPNDITIPAGESSVLNFDLEVYPYYIDRIARADGVLKNITFSVFSKGARQSNLEVEGETTDPFLCQVFLKEYRHATFTAISPSSQTICVSETRTVNVTLRNEGNAEERYYLHKTGENGQGSHTNWYDFNRTSVLLQPLESVQLSIQVAPIKPEVGQHRLEFYAQSETYYSTDEEDFDIDIEESFGGYFVSWEEKQSLPGRTVNMRITVRNTGNARHEFSLDTPSVPVGWDTPTWTSGSQKMIDAYSSEQFTLEIEIPSDFTRAEAGLYQFEINGWYEDEGGNLSRIPGPALLNLTVTPYFLFTMESPVQSKDVIPGEQCQFIIEIRNIGNFNDTIILDLQEVSFLEDAIQWTIMEGPDPEGAIPVPVGEMIRVIFNVSVPEFSILAEEPMSDLYGFKVRAYSQAEPGIEREITFEIEVNQVSGLSLWCENPGRDVMKGSYEEIHLYYAISVRNLGNAYDDIAVTIPEDEFNGPRSGWEFQIGGMSINTVHLDSMSQLSTSLELIIDPGTPAGHYTLRITGRSLADSNALDEITIFINISQPNYDFYFEKNTDGIPSVNPANGPEIEFKFTITNSGNYYDSYRLEVLTSMLSGRYQGWRIEFEDNDGIRQGYLDIPMDLSDYPDNEIGKGDEVTLSLYVIPAIDSGEGPYNDINISIVSDGDMHVKEEHNFSIWIVRPNILIDDDPAHFNLNPDSGIREGDTIEIIVTVRNTGDAETGSFYVWFYNGKADSLNEMEGFPIGVDRVDTIKPGSETLITISWKDIPFGQNDIFVFADKPIRLGDKKTEIQGEFNPNGQVWESTENDNYATISDGFREKIDIRPDLSIMEVDFGDPVADSTSRVAVYISNHGSGKAWHNDVSIQVMVDGEYLRDTKFNSPDPSGPDIEPLDTEDRYFTWDVPKKPGNHTVTVYVHCTTSSNGTIEFSTIVMSRESEDDGSVLSTDPVWFHTILGLLLGIALTVGFLFVSGNLGLKLSRNDAKEEKRSAKQMDPNNKKDTRSFSMERRSIREGTDTSSATMKKRITGNYIPIPVSENRPFNPPPYLSQRTPSSTSNNKKDIPINCPRCDNMVDPEIPFCVRCGYSNIFTDDSNDVGEKGSDRNSIQDIKPDEDRAETNVVSDRITVTEDQQFNDVNGPINEDGEEEKEQISKEEIDQETEKQ